MGNNFNLLSPSGGSWTYTLLYSFTGGAYCGPRGNLVMDGAGNARRLSGSILANASILP